MTRPGPARTKRFRRCTGVLRSGGGEDFDGRTRVVRGAARAGPTLDEVAVGRSRSPAGREVAGWSSRAARRQVVSRRREASAGRPEVAGASAVGAGGGGAVARCYDRRRRRGRGLEHADSRRVSDPAEGGGGWGTQRRLRPSGERLQNYTGHVQLAGRVSPPTLAYAGGRSFEEPQRRAGREWQGTSRRRRGTSCTGRWFSQPLGPSTSALNMGCYHATGAGRPTAGGETWMRCDGRQA